MRSDGGCDFAARPSRTSLDEPIFWAPEADSSVVLLVDVPPCLPSEHNRAANLDASSGKEGVDGLSFYHPGHPHDIQILIVAGSNPMHPLAAIIPLDDSGLDRLASVERLWRALHQRPVAPKPDLTKQQRISLREMLRAVDGRTNGATYREIAEVLFGAIRVASEPWKTSALRDKTYRLVRNGKKMVGGGYRSLLLHRHRS